MTYRARSSGVLAGAAGVLVVVLAACVGDAGPAGPAGDSGSDGEPGAAGNPGAAGTDGDDGRSPWFAGSGLRIEVTSATIDDSDRASLALTITDDRGVPLDATGLFTEGEVELRFSIARLEQAADGTPLQYTSYTTRDQTSGGTTETQAWVDPDGTLTEIGVGQGTYTYQFGTSVVVPDASHTHTVGVFAWRTYRDVRYVSNDSFDFVPLGDPVVVTRDVVRTDACNSCHNPMESHDGLIRETSLCILCHQPQTTDPDSGNILDARVMFHKIHFGAQLPSVIAGSDYLVIGDGSTHNYSTIEFPRDVRTCTTCHTGAQGDYWKERPSQSACGSCHDRISFAASPPVGFSAHPGGPQGDDNDCATCHPASGTFAAIVDSHLIPSTDPRSPVLAVTIDSVTNTAPGQTPVVDFSVSVDGVARDILTLPLASLAFTVAGPTTDFGIAGTATAQGAGASGSLSAIDAAAGKFRFTLPAVAAIAPNATGSIAVGAEASIEPGGPGTPRYFAFNPVVYAAVTDVTAVARRKVVETGLCESCHLELDSHDGLRRNAEYCVLCHNPDSTNDERVARFEGTSVVARSLDFKVMIHGIHRGEDHESSFVLGSLPAPTISDPLGTPLEFADLRFPGDLRSCGTCHLAGSFALPLASTVRASRSERLTCTESPAADGDDYCDTRTSTDLFTPPTAAVCTACHDAPASAAHAEVMTTASGAESCATCHGNGAAFDINAVHRTSP